MYYGRNQEERKVRAQFHTEEMERHHSEEILKSFHLSSIYGGEFRSPEPVSDRFVQRMHVQVVNEDSTSAIFHHAQGKTAVLNFASYKHPGGGFANGRIAQEEALCHASYLYNALNMIDQETSFYIWNQVHTNNGLYENRAVYSPGIRFFMDDTSKLCDVITCAAPNNSIGGILEEDNRKALESRITFIRDIALENQVDTLILGAFGCGVFKQDPRIVAEVFKNVFLESQFEKLIFAIPDAKVTIFDEVFSNI